MQTDSPPVPLGQRQPDRFAVTKVAVLLLLVLASAAHATLPECKSSCAFYFCDKEDSNVEVGSRNDAVLTSTICRKGGHAVGVVRTGEAYLLYAEGQRKKRISKLGQKLPASFFKTYNVPALFGKGARSGIGHERVMHRAQQEFFREKCWMLPVEYYQRVINDAGELRIIKAYPYGDDCISFSSTFNMRAESNTEEY